MKYIREQSRDNHVIVQLNKIFGTRWEPQSVSRDMQPGSGPKMSVFLILEGRNDRKFPWRRCTKMKYNSVI